MGLLLRPKPRYPWWQWVLVALVWAGVTFGLFSALTGFSDVALTAVIIAVALVLSTMWTRQRIVACERRGGESATR